MKNVTRWILLTAFATGLLNVAPCAFGAMAADKDRPLDEKKDDKKDPPVVDPGLKLTDYQELMTRNLFSRIQRRTTGGRGDYGRGGLREEPDRMTMIERERNAEIISAQVSAGKGEMDIIFRGSFDRDGVTTATMEDRRADKTILVKTGDKLAGGKVGRVTLNMMEYIVGEKTTEVAFGSNLLGNAPSSRPVSSSAPSTAPAGSVSGSGDTKSAGDVKGGGCAR